MYQQHNRPFLPLTEDEIREYLLFEASPVSDSVRQNIKYLHFLSYQNGHKTYLIETMKENHHFFLKI